MTHPRLFGRLLITAILVVAVGILAPREPLGGDDSIKPVCLSTAVAGSEDQSPAFRSAILSGDWIPCIKSMPSFG